MNAVQYQRLMMTREYNRTRYPRLCCKTNNKNENYAAWYRLSRNGHYWKLEKWCKKHDFVYWTQISMRLKDLTY